MENAFFKIYLICNSPDFIKSLYYNLESSFLFGVSEQDGTAIYTLNRMGTNQGGSTFSFVFEGSTTISSDDFLKKYGK